MDMTKSERDAVQHDIVSMREYMEALLYDQKAFFEAKLEAMSEAQAKYEAYNRAKLETMNEIREQLSTQKAEFITRVEHDAKYALFATKIESLQKFIWMLSGALVLLEVLLKFIK